MPKRSKTNYINRHKLLMHALVGHENSKGTFKGGQNYHIVRGVYKRQKPLIIKYVFNSHSHKTALKNLPTFFKTVIKPLWLPALTKVWTNGAEEAENFIKDWHGTVKKIAKADYQDYADQFLADHGASKIDGITDTDQQWLANTLRSGVSEGLSTSDIASNLTDDFDDMSDSRAMTIVRTETNGAFSYASNETAKDLLPDGSTKVWWTTSDNPRPSHQDMEGTEIDIDDVFEFDDGECAYPCDPDGPDAETINCMCVLEYSAGSTETEEEND